MYQSKTFVQYDRAAAKTAVFSTPVFMNRRWSGRPIPKAKLSVLQGLRVPVKGRAFPVELAKASAKP